MLIWEISLFSVWSPGTDGLREKTYTPHPWCGQYHCLEVTLVSVLRGSTSRASHRQKVAWRECVRSLVRRPLFAEMDGPGGGSVLVLRQWHHDCVKMSSFTGAAGARCKLSPGPPQADLGGFSTCPWKQMHAHTHCGTPAPAPGFLSYKGCLGTEQLELPAWRCAVMSCGEPSNKPKTSLYFQSSAMCCH